MSPDLNPIEHLRGILKQKVEKRHMSLWWRIPATTCAGPTGTRHKRWALTWTLKTS